MVVVLTNKAKLSIRNTANYIKDIFGKARALSFGDEVAKVLDLLADNPCMGRLEQLLSDEPKQYRSFVVQKLNTLIYYVEDDKVIVSYLWNNRKNPLSLREHL